MIGKHSDADCEASACQALAERAPNVPRAQRDRPRANHVLSAERVPSAPWARTNNVHCAECVASAC